MATPVEEAHNEIEKAPGVESEKNMDKNEEISESVETSMQNIPVSDGKTGAASGGISNQMLLEEIEKLKAEIAEKDAQNAQMATQVAQMATQNAKKDAKIAKITALVNSIKAKI